MNILIKVTSVLMGVLLVLLAVGTLINFKKMWSARNSEVEYAVVTHKTTFGGPHVTVLYDVVYNDEVMSFSKTCYLNAEQYAAISVGDVVAFDENNNPIFK